MVSSVRIRQRNDFEQLAFVLVGCSFRDELAIVVAMDAENRTQLVFLALECIALSVP